MNNAQLRRETKKHRSLVKRLINAALGLAPLKDADLFESVRYLTEIERSIPAGEARPSLYTVIDALLTEVMHTYRRRREERWSAAA